MHEVSIAYSLLRQVADVAERNGLSTVQGVGVAVGRLSGVVPDALAFAFEVLRQGPVVGSAELEVRHTDGLELQLEWVQGEP